MAGCHQQRPHRLYLSLCIRTAMWVTSRPFTVLSLTYSASNQSRPVKTGKSTALRFELSNSQHVQTKVWALHLCMSLYLFQHDCERTCRSPNLRSRWGSGQKSHSLFQSSLDSVCLFRVPTINTLFFQEQQKEHITLECAQRISFYWHMNTADVSYLKVCVLSPPPSWSVSDISLSLSLCSVS